jgi:dihydroceramidase
MEGFWEPHTSSIDFCETNYLHTSHIVEIHNTWSSIIGIALFGVLGLLYGNPTQELRFALAYVDLIVIGMGSAFLHGTLHWVFQSSDELPMVYLSTILVYICFELETSSPSLKYPNLPFYLVLISIVNTLVYYGFQDLYWVFLFTFNSSLGAYAFMIGSMFYKGHEITKNVTSRKIVCLAMITYIFIASPIWVIDILCCKWVLLNIAANMFGMTPHILWHFSAGYAGYCTIVYLESFRMQALRKSFSAKYLLGIIPLIVPTSDGDDHNVTSKED